MPARASSEAGFHGTRGQAISGRLAASGLSAFVLLPGVFALHPLEGTVELLHALVLPHGKAGGVVQEFGGVSAGGAVEVAAFRYGITVLAQGTLHVQHAVGDGGVLCA